MKKILIITAIIILIVVTVAGCNAQKTSGDYEDVKNITLNSQQQAMYDKIISNKSSWIRRDGKPCRRIGINELDGIYYLACTYYDELPKQDFSATVTVTYHYRITNGGIEDRISLDEGNKVQIWSNNLSSVSFSADGTLTEQQDDIKKLVSKI
ncbi:MAG: hypothetical protein PUC88_04770 [Clostridia bacterium]|nr:hypothetical protein [Clostridia bacterium]